MKASRLSKIGNIIFYILVIIGIIIIFSRYKGTDNTKKYIGLWYVYSGSMDPTIKTNDGYILIKSKEYKLGDIVTFKPKVLKDKYVTHRIIEVIEGNKFITLGDNNQSTDQEFGEPPVLYEQIIGKVFTVGGKPIIIPYLGIISERFNNIVKEFNIFILLSIGVGIYLIEYIIDSFLNRHKHSRHKKMRRMDIAQYLDPVFLILCSLIFINSILIGLTIKSWIPLETSYVVVATEGVSSPMMGEKFNKTLNLENQTFIPFVAVLEPEREGIEINPSKLLLLPKQNVEYSLTIKAPDKIGYYTEKILNRAYPNVLSDKWFDYIYSKSMFLPLILIFSPGIILTFVLFIWWVRRWKIGRRRVMEWQIPFIKVLRRVL